MEARCPHEWSHLGAEGVVDGPEIVCAAHFWRFDHRRHGEQGGHDRSPRPQGRHRRVPVPGGRRPDRGPAPERVERTAMTEMEGRRILITGPTGQVGLPVALALAEHNDVFGVARFGDADRARPGSRPPASPASAPTSSAGDFSGVPADVDHVANFAVAKTGDFERDLAANVESLGMLMHHCREASVVPALLVDRRVPAQRPPRLRRGRPPGRQPPARSASCRPTRSPRSRPRPWPATAPASGTCRRPSPGCRCPTATTAAGPPSTSR